MKKIYLIMIFFLFNSFLFAFDKKFNNIEELKEKCVQSQKEYQKTLDVIKILNTVKKDKQYINLMNALSLGEILELNKQKQLKKSYTFENLINLIIKELNKKKDIVKKEEINYCNKNFYKNPVRKFKFNNVNLFYTVYKKMNNYFIEKKYENDYIYTVPDKIYLILSLYGYKNKEYLKFLHIYSMFLKREYKNKTPKSFNPF